jgi:ergothioneine biosynthesis protein EgtB
MSRVAILRQQLEEAREQTLHLCAQVNEADFCRQIHREFSPLGWHLGHIGVTEAYWILRQCQGEPTLSAGYDRLFTPTDTPKPERVHLPARDEILAYLHIVRERVLSILAGVDFDSDHPLLRDARIFNMLLQHEEQHQETMLLILRLFTAERYDSSLLEQSVGTRDFPSPLMGEGQGEGATPQGRPLPLTPSHQGREDKHASALPLDPNCRVLSPPGEGGISPSSDQGMIMVPAGPFLMGSNDIAQTLDNERPQHSVFVPAFLIDRCPVTNADFLAFVAGSGYHERSCWSTEGWQWREQHRVEHPLSWRRQQSGEWVEIGLPQSGPLRLQHPVQSVSWYEADAYARWIGKRLPTEEEWEKAASWDPERQEKLLSPRGDRTPGPATSDRDASGESTTRGDRGSASRSPYGCADMLGNVWEWTATWFQPYRGFAAFPYEGYSVPYFDWQHRVLRGGSWATRRHVLRTTFRNWYQPWVREIFAGFRCAKDR